MRYGIPIHGNRVAPRSTCAESVLVAVRYRNHARSETRCVLPGPSVLDLAKVLSDNRIDVLVCGGISREDREFLTARNFEIIDNVAGTVDELLAALEADELQAGFGLSTSMSEPRTTSPSQSTRQTRGEADTDSAIRSTGVTPPDCLACRNRVCLNGQICEAALSAPASPVVDPHAARVMEATLDISFEHDRTLCRLSELIYFCLEMRYEKIGLAYCTELEEPANILARVLRRFFTVYPVCCKIGGELVPDSMMPSPAARPPHSPDQVACNPAGQAEALNSLGTDINVLVGLCMGADCLLAHLSHAPVTTLFVKDKSLANNPIGAVYSDYYIEEAIQAGRADAARSEIR